MGEAAQPALAGKRDHYERRRPEDTTVLYQLVQKHLETLRPRRANVIHAFAQRLKAAGKPANVVIVASSSAS